MLDIACRVGLGSITALGMSMAQVSSRIGSLRRVFCLDDVETFCCLGRWPVTAVGLICCLPSKYGLASGRNADFSSTAVLDSTVEVCDCGNGFAKVSARFSGWRSP